MGRPSKRTLHARKMALSQHAAKRAKTVEAYEDWSFEMDDTMENEDSSSEEEQDTEVSDGDEPEFDEFVLSSPDSRYGFC